MGKDAMRGKGVKIWSKSLSFLSTNFSTEFDSSNHPPLPPWYPPPPQARGRPSSSRSSCVPPGTPPSKAPPAWPTPRALLTASWLGRCMGATFGEVLVVCGKGGEGASSRYQTVGGGGGATVRRWATMGVGGSRAFRKSGGGRGGVLVYRRRRGGAGFLTNVLSLGREGPPGRRSNEVVVGIWKWGVIAAPGDRPPSGAAWPGTPPRPPPPKGGGECVRLGLPPPLLGGSSTSGRKSPTPAPNSSATFEHLRFMAGVYTPPPRKLRRISNLQW